MCFRGDMGKYKKFHEIIAVIFLVFGVSEVFSVLGHSESSVTRISSVIVVSYLLLIFVKEYLKSKRRNNEED